MGVRSFIKSGVRLGVGVARFAAKEIEERVGRRREPTANMPANPEPPEERALETQLDEDALQPVGSIDVKVLRAEMESELPPVLLDCREPHEWEAGYIEGCVHIPMNTIPERLGELDPTRRTVVYCLHGIRSAQVASWLATAHGFTNTASVDGGIVSWYSEFNQDRIIVRRSMEI